MIKKLIYFDSVEEFNQYYQSKSFKEQILDWELETVNEIWWHRFKIKLIRHSPDLLNQQVKLPEVEKVLNQYIKGTPVGLSKLFFQKIPFSQMIQSEISELKQVKSEWSVHTFPEIAKSYLEFLENLEPHAKIIDKMTVESHTWLQPLSQKQTNNIEKFINNSNVLQKELLGVFEFADAEYAEYLKSLKNLSEAPIYSLKKINNLFNIQDYIQPAWLNLSSKKIKAYHTVIMGWVAQLLQHRKQQLHWEQTPSFYVFAEEIINLYQKDPNNTNSKQHKNKKQPTEYPKNIFNKAEDYEFFRCLIKHATLKNQISFIYRMMAEIESPPKIVVKDTPFRDWYNKQNEFPIKLNQCTITFNNAKNDDRVHFYKTLKELFFKE